MLLIVVAYTVLAAWAPRVWAVSIPQIALFAAVLAFAFKRLRAGVALRFPLFLAAPVAIAAIGALQMVMHWTVYRLPTANAALDWAGYAACGWLAAQMRLTREELDRPLTWCCVLAGTVGALAIATAFTSPFHIFWLIPVRFEQVFGPYVYRNHLAAFAELTLPIVIFQAIRQRERRGLFVTAAAVLVSSVVIAASRTGVVLLALELLLLLVLATWKRWLAPKSAMLFSVLLIAAVLAGAAAVGTTALGNRFVEDHPYRVRFEILQSTLDMARARPLTGFGLGNFRTVYPEYSRIDPGVLVNEAHNDWAQWAAEGGLPAAFAMLLFAGWAVGVGMRKGWAVGIAAVCCHALVDYPFEEPSVVLLLMLLAGLAWQCGADEETPRSHRRTAQQRSRPTVPESLRSWADPVAHARRAE
jgi:O-antigen ligase